MLIPLNFLPRWYQAAALTALDNGSIMNIWCWARRGGKDFTGFGYAVKKMVESPMNVVLVFPTKEQGKNSFWENVENDGFKTIEQYSGQPDCPPGQLQYAVSRSRTVRPFKSWVRLKPDSLRGANAKLYIFSEFVDIPSCGPRCYPTDYRCQRWTNYYSKYPENRRHLRWYVQGFVRPRSR